MRITGCIAAHVCNGSVAVVQTIPRVRTCRYRFSTRRVSNLIADTFGEYSHQKDYSPRMKKFLQENPTIAYGLGLPLLLVVIFLIVSGLPQLLVAKPQYELLYATGTHNYPNVVQITVVEQKVQVIYQGAAYGNERPRLWRYNPQTGGVQEIAIILPPSPVSSANRSMHFANANNDRDRCTRSRRPEN